MATLDASLETKAQHTFTLSGLGVAPFSICRPNDPITRGINVFFCEHCGTQLKNRHFVRSADGIVSVVGIDCLTKTGDQGLIAGARRLKRELQQEDRERARSLRAAKAEEMDRERLGGLSRDECISKIEQEIDLRLERHRTWVENHPMYRYLSKPGFEAGMQQKLLGAEPLSKGMLSALRDVLAKKISGGRKNSRTYKGVLPKVSQWLDEVTAVVDEVYHATSVDRARIRELLNGYLR